MPLGREAAKPKETLNNWHFERSEKSMGLIANDFSLCSE